MLDLSQSLVGGVGCGGCCSGRWARLLFWRRRRISAVYLGAIRALLGVALGFFISTINLEPRDYCIVCRLWLLVLVGLIAEECILSHGLLCWVFGRILRVARVGRGEFFSIYSYLNLMAL